MQNPLTDIRQKFQDIEVSPEWCFKNVRSTEQWTHGYHRYPAKFLPNIVKKLIEDLTNQEDVIADLFAGCGTTLVEAKVHGRKSIGVDINPVAQLITNAKINPIDPNILAEYSQKLIDSLDSYDEAEYQSIESHKRIDYWFFPEHKSKIAFLYSQILMLTTNENQLRDFYLCALSNILKNCSKWLQSSTKPQVDPKKSPVDPFKAFKFQVNSMKKKNDQFFYELSDKDLLETECDILIEDARTTSIKSESVSAIITSPPYVTSYEYADIHQLTAYWYEYISDLSMFRKNFIGTFYSLNQETVTSSFIGQDIINQLKEKDARTAKEVANYFNDMTEVGREMNRILKPGGHACLVIGNTTLKDVKIKSAEVFAEILQMLDFKLVDVIKRSIPVKLIPTIRDKKSGRFTKLTNKNSKLVYPEEYIIIARK